MSNSDGNPIYVRQQILFTLKLMVWLLLLAVTSCSDVIKSSYPNFTSAKNNQAFERGWLPPTLPTSAYNIYEEHNLDRNTGYGTFLFQSKDVQDFRRQLTPISTDILIKAIKRYQYNDEVGKLKQQGFDFYVAEKQFYFAIDWSTCKGVFWLIP